MNRNFSILLMMVSSLLILSSCSSEKTSKTKSGFTVNFHESNEGPTPQEGEWMYFRYTERRNQDVVYALEESLPDAKFKVPAENSTDQSLRKYITEALLLMSPGDSVTMVLTYSDEYASIMQWGPGDTSYFDLRLTAIKDEESYQADLEAERQAQIELQKVNAEKADELESELKGYVDQYNAGTLSDLKTFPSGLKMYVLTEGDGNMASQGDRVNVDYFGMLLDGTPFDNSIKRGTPFNFALGRQQVIAGWDEALSNVKEGTRAVIFLPPALAYGERGSPPTIPPNSELAFFIEFKGISK